MMRISLKVLLEIILAITVATLACTIIPIMHSASIDAIDIAVDKVMRRTNERVVEAIHAYFYDIYIQTDVLARLFARRELIADYDNKAELERLRLMLWDFTITNPRALYVFMLTWPQGGYYGFTQDFFQAANGGEPYYDWYATEGEFEHVWIADPKTGEPDYSEDHGFEMNATKEGELYTAEGESPAPPGKTAWSFSYLYEDQSVGDLYIMGFARAVHINGTFIGEFAIDYSCYFFSAFLKSLVQLPSEVYFIIDASDKTYPGDFGSAAPITDYRLVGSSDPRYRLTYTDPVSEAIMAIPFKNYSFNSTFGPTAVPAMIQGEVDAVFGGFPQLHQDLQKRATEGNVSIEDVHFTRKTTLDGSDYYIRLSIHAEREMRLFIITAVKESEYTGKIRDGLTMSIMLVSFVSVGILLLSAVCVYLLLVPLAYLVASMERATYMDLVIMEPSSRISEVFNIQMAFFYLSTALQEYKSFLPQRLFTNDDDPSDLDAPSDSGRSSLSISSTGSERDVKVLVAASSTQTVAVLLTNIRGFNDALAEIPEVSIPRLYSQFLGKIWMHVTKSHGTVDRLNGDRILCSWRKGTAQNCRTSALKTAQNLREDRMVLQVGFIRGLGLGLSMGKAFCGYLGTTSAKAYTVIGVCVKLASFLSEVAAEFCEADSGLVLCDTTFVEVAPMAHITLVVGIVKLRRETELVWFVGDYVDSNEWLYSVVEEGENEGLASSAFNTNMKQWLLGDNTVQATSPNYQIGALGTLLERAIHDSNRSLVTFKSYLRDNETAL
eukprot:Sspe_Gene.26708::Locus_11232_Transcript_1_1_Confidence_1.000_Length_2627::g.26708::m.26708